MWHVVTKGRVSLKRYVTLSNFGISNPRSISALALLTHSRVSIK